MSRNVPTIRWGRAGLMLALLSASAAASAENAMVGIEGYRFVPEEVSIRVGESVTWTNQEKRTSHSMVFPAEGGLESERLFPGESWRRQFSRAGRYDYHCGPHPEMKGVVVVRD